MEWNVILNDFIYIIGYLLDTIHSSFYHSKGFHYTLIKKHPYIFLILHIPHRIAYILVQNIASTWFNGQNYFSLCCLMVFCCNGQATDGDKMPHFVVISISWISCDSLPQWSFEKYYWEEIKPLKSDTTAVWLT